MLKIRSLEACVHVIKRQNYEACLVFVYFISYLGTETSMHNVYAPVGT